MKGLCKVVAVILILLLLLPLGSRLAAARDVSPAISGGETTNYTTIPVDVTLSGWGWSPDAQPGENKIALVSLPLTGSLVLRPGASEVADIYLTGTLVYEITGVRTDYYRDLELRGIKTRSFFYLREVKEETETNLAARMTGLEGFWLEENNYLMCEGRLTIPLPGQTAKPYFFFLRTDEVKPQRTLNDSGWVGTIESAVGLGLEIADEVVDNLIGRTPSVSEMLNKVLAGMAKLALEFRRLLTPEPYLP